jgi:tetratricopeptide (TPR) repeat protein
VHHHLGLIEGRSGSADQAVAEFRKAVELDPAHVDAAFDLGAALGLLGRYTEAAAAYRHVLSEDPASVRAWLGEAIALNLAGNPRGALEVAEEGWRVNPGSVELLHALARLLASADDPSVRDGDRALDLAGKTFRAGSTVERLETLAMAYAETGQFDEAVETQKKAISQAGWQGRTNLVPTLEANLARYQTGQSCCAEPTARE